MENPEICVLKAGVEIHITKTRHLEDEQRVRARIPKPAGWTTLKNIESGMRWAERRNQRTVKQEETEDVKKAEAENVKKHKAEDMKKAEEQREADNAKKQQLKDAEYELGRRGTQKRGTGTEADQTLEVGRE